MDDETRTEQPARKDEADSHADVEALAETIAALQAELEAARAAEQAAVSDAQELRGSLDAAQAQVRDAAGRYREARLTAAPEVLPELVPESDDIAEIDRGMDAALRLVSHVREQARHEATTPAPAALRVPAGAPSRRAADLSSLSAAEKIRVGLESLSETSRG